MTCDVCRGDSGPYRRCADPHTCNARLEGQRDALEAVIAGLRAYCEDEFDVVDGSDGPRPNEYMRVSNELDRLCAERKVAPTPK